MNIPDIQVTTDGINAKPESQTNQEAYQEGYNDAKPNPEAIELLIKRGRLEAVEEYRMELIKQIEEMYGSYGTFTGTLGYQGIVMGIDSYQQESDKIRDRLLDIMGKSTSHTCPINNKFEKCEDKGE